MENNETPTPEITPPPAMLHHFLCSAEMEYIEGKHNKSTNTAKLDLIYRAPSVDLNVKSLEEIQQAFQMKFYKERVKSAVPLRVTDVTILAISHIFFGTEDSFFEGSSERTKGVSKLKSLPNEQPSH